MAVPDIIKPSLVRLDHEQMAIFNQMYNKSARSIGLAYILWFLLGFHYIYLKKYGTAIIFWITFGGLLLWWLIDILRIPFIVKQVNEEFALTLLSKIKSL